MTHGIGILGGTFNPIHFGHLRTATEVAEQLRLKQVRIIPCALPPHRKLPGVSAQQRLAMAQLAIENSELLCVDDRELNREGHSYTIHTLESLREEFPKEPLLLILGMDSFHSLPRWFEWQRLLDYAHIVVVSRLGRALPHEGRLATLLEQQQENDIEKLKQHNHGKLHVLSVTGLNISATLIRERIAQGLSPRFLTPNPVCDFISEHKLYG